MAHQTDGRRLTRIENLRYGLVAMVLSSSFFFLIYVRDRSAWSWRLALLGVIVGPLAYVVSLLFRMLLLPLRGGRYRLIVTVMTTPLDFIGGCIAFVIAYNAIDLVGLAPPLSNGPEKKTIMLVVGLMTAEVGVLFYLFHLTSKRLVRSAQRIKEHEFAERELELARTIQERLLPPEMMEGDGYRIRARNLAARYVAGDFYDAFHLADGTLGFAVGDVAGKGIGASLIMATVKAILPLVAEGRRPAQTLTELNRKLHRELPRHTFVALAYGRLDPHAGTIEIANAGLPDQYLLRQGGDAQVLSVSGPRLPVGAWRGVVYESLIVPFQLGDAVLLLTDGLAEATTASGEQFGYEKLLQVLNDAVAKQANVLDTVFDTVGRLAPEKLEDDCTGLLLTRIQA